jgi:hypothetical protein
MVVCPMVLRRTHLMRISELGELTRPHRMPRAVHPMRSTGASGVNLIERVLTIASEI